MLLYFQEALRKEKLYRKNVDEDDPNVEKTRCRRDVFDDKTRFQSDDKTRFQSDDKTRCRRDVSEERDESVSPQMRRTLISRRPGSDAGLIIKFTALRFWEMAWFFFLEILLFLCGFCNQCTHTYREWEM